MLKSILRNYSDAYILVSRTIILANRPAHDADANNNNKNVIFKNYAPITDCTSEIDNIQVDKYCGSNADV